VCKQVDHVPEPVYEVPLMADGMAALEAIDAELGLAFDDWDKKYYYNMFVYVADTSLFQSACSYMKVCALPLIDRFHML
jgi:hypothetical protein